MAADVHDTICLGFGSWSSVNWLPTLGFAIGGVVTGTFELVAAQVYVNGPVAASVYRDGAVTSQVYLDGAVAAEAKPE